MSNLLIIFILFATANLILKIFLSELNRRYILKMSSKVPERFQKLISLPEHQKAAAYSNAKSKFTQVKIITSFILLMLWIPMGGLQFLDHWASSFGLSNFKTGIILLSIIGCIDFIIFTPFSLYSTFVIEEKFGFNNTTLKLFFIDIIKSSLIGIPIGVGIFWVLISFIENFKNSWWYITWFFLMSFQFFMLWFYPKFISPLFNKFTALDNKELKSSIDNLSKKTGINFKDYFVIDASIRSSHGNAYFTGFGNNKRIVFFDTLLNTLLPNEVIAVLSHELGHLKHKHIQKSLIKMSIFLLLGLFALNYIHNDGILYRVHSTLKSPYMMIILFNMISGTYLFFLTPFQSYFSRKNEFEADRFAAKYTNAYDLISALIKLYKENSSSLTTHPWYSKFYFSHPPALERVRYLEEQAKA